MSQYNEFVEKYAAYEGRYVEKKAFVENLLPYVIQHVPALANHLPPEGAIGLAATAAKFLAMKGLGRAATAANETLKLKKRFGTGLTEAYKMRGTPGANIALGKGIPTPPDGKFRKAMNVVDKGTDVATVGYNAVLLGKHLL